MIHDIHSLYLRQFSEKLAEVTSPSSPVAEERHLKGRSEQIKAVKQAIYAPGRHVFIYGERGVGKTSLAKTAGKEAATDTSYFKQIGCAADSTFEDIVRQIVEVFDPSRLETITKTKNFGLGKYLGFSQQTANSPAQRLSVSQAADILASLDEDDRGEIRVVLIDEVERIPSDDIRKSFAELVKLLGDRGARITLVFTGVGDDLLNILGAHESAFRQFLQVKLERLDYQFALDIVDDALRKFSLSPELEPVRTARFRIASIANGFPYYVHLLTERLLYTVYEDRSTDEVTLNHLQSAIAQAVEGVSEQIRKPYDRATRGRSDVYKLATWAVADSWDLERMTPEIYASYEGLSKILGRPMVTRQRFSQVLASLKKAEYGPMLRAGFRQGQYVFLENISRGYVRLRAAAEDIQLNDLRPDSPLLPSSVGSRTRRQADTSSAGMPPRGFKR